MGTVFISYRREITAGEARALFNELLGKLGKNSVFMDVDSIALGRDFRGALQKTLESCDLMLVLIGRDWAEIKDEEGRPRLHNPGDFVRLEIEAALKRDIVVTPILVQGAHMPAPEQLPAEIRDLVYRNGFELSHSRWESDFAEMTRRLELDIAKEGGRVEQPASIVAAPNASIAPAAQPAIPGRQFLRPLRVTRRHSRPGRHLWLIGNKEIVQMARHEPGSGRLLRHNTDNVLPIPLSSLAEKGLLAVVVEVGAVLELPIKTAVGLTWQGRHERPTRKGACRGFHIVLDIVANTHGEQL